MGHSPVFCLTLWLVFGFLSLCDWCFWIESGLVGFLVRLMLIGLIVYGKRLDL